MNVAQMDILHTKQHIYFRAVVTKLPVLILLCQIINKSVATLCVSQQKRTFISLKYTMFLIKMTVK